MDLSVLLDTPGVDTDRRILRLAFFAELAWRFSLQSGAWDRKRQASAVPPTPVVTDSSAEAVDHTRELKKEQDHFQKGTKVVIAGLEKNESLLVFNGTEGRISAFPSLTLVSRKAYVLHV